MNWDNDNFFSDLLDKSTASRHIEQGSDEWDQIRCGRFTASEMYLLMDSGKREMTAEELKARPKSGPGSSAKLITDHSVISEKASSYIYKKVAEALTGKPADNAYAYPLVYGKNMEDEAAEYAAEKFQWNITKVGFQAFGDHAGGSPDRFVGEDEGLEIKCPWTSEKQIEYMMLTDVYDLKRCFPQIYWQVMSNLFFCLKKRWHLVTYDPRFIDDRHKLTHMVIEPNNDDFDLISVKLEVAVREKLKLIQLLSK